jgi:two-component system cell cycle sensor histidine kinase/response regulator CckA
MHSSDLHPASHRILVVDDNATIHEDIRKILCPVQAETDLLEAESLLFGKSANVKPRQQTKFRIDSAYQGQEGLAMVERSLAENDPYVMAFVDVRMPPGWDGIETIRHIWNRYPGLQIVICSAYSDHSWEDIVRTLGESDSFVILKKPFDNIEVLQLAHAMVKKWVVTQQANLRLSELDEMVARQTAKLTAANEQLRAEIRRREQTEMELQGSEHRFALAFKASAIPMAVMHASSRVYIEVNESFTVLSARSREEIIGKTSNEMQLLARPEDCDIAMETVRREGRVRNFTLRIVAKGGAIRETQLSLEPVVLGEEACLLVAMLDVTEQRKLEAQLRQSQKMDAIGQLAAGVAHDFNNLLTIIHGHASLQMARPNQDAQMAHSLTQVKMAADRAATLTRQLLAFSRKQVMQPRALSLNESIQHSQAMLKRLLGETITLDCSCAPELPCVFADENSIDQVIMNLVVNARDAMPNGGTLRLVTSVVRLGAEDMPNHPDARPGEFVRLSVIDNGTGIDTAVLNRIFEPFFTTKPQGKGTGLGLSTVYGIVKQHDGWVEVESAPGLGSKFHVYLAVTTKTRVTTHETSLFKIDPAPAHKETVLVVEDETVLREFVTTLLQQQGYIVLEAADGLEALQVCQQTVAKIDLLLTDMVMPNGISGAKLAQQMLARRKDLKVLYTSGYSQELMENAGRLVIGTNFLPKPFDVNKLLKAVRRCLESESPNATKTTGLIGVEA